MVKFDINSRLDLEESPDRMNSQVLSEISKIESMAKVMRESGKSKEHIQVKLAPEVDNLIYRVQEGNRNNISLIDSAIDEIKADYIKARDKKPQEELVQIERAKLKYGTMTDKEIEETALVFDKDSAPLSFVESQVIMGRLPDAKLKEMFRENLHKTRTDQPWINTPESNSLLDDREKFELAGSGIIAQGMKLSVDTLIDYGDELSRYDDE